VYTLQVQTLEEGEGGAGGEKSQAQEEVRALRAELAEVTRPTPGHGLSCGGDPEARKRPRTGPSEPTPYAIPPQAAAAAAPPLPRPEPAGAETGTGGSCQGRHGCAQEGGVQQGGGRGGEGRGGGGGVSRISALPEELIVYVTERKATSKCHLTKDMLG